MGEIASRFSFGFDFSALGEQPRVYEQNADG
jgi:hypothetical protein